MAEVRPSSSSLPVVTPLTPGRSGEAVRAAQRAFFDAALNASQASPAAHPASAPEAAAGATAAPPPPRATRLQVDPTGAPLTRGSRPGSLLDIRV